MHIEVERWSDGKLGLSLGMCKEEVRALVSALQVIAADPEQHFHISSTGKAESAVGSIEVYIKTPAEPDNVSLSSLALGPGEEI